ncbi:hypothetical protein NLG97_g5196 [Lecanicillium saksenae]|uniref:Uncharacterized protein n=1 Tax=Lecanicillium saksenae TaxID=468837 RepID=A0ACC1QTB2_9HYPO|nr:hypothetical protein NLG97_g5196 [Lecanicillium saksenae]
MPGPKPKLEVATPVTSNFPSSITSANTATPLSGLPLSAKLDPDFIKTPISPPPAYTDFLTKAMSLNSPIIAMAAAGDASPDSAPTSDASDQG